MKDDFILSESKCILYRSILFSDSSTKEDLMGVCMELAHKKSINALDLLLEFKQSRRSSEVEWLDCAIEEGKWWYFDPRNEGEDKEYFILKILQELEDEIIQLETDIDELNFQFRKDETINTAIKELVKNREVDKGLLFGFQEMNKQNVLSIAHKRDDIELKEKIISILKNSIKTERYKNMDLSEMRSVHFTG